MGVLDDLKREAKQIKELQAEATEKATQERESTAKRIEPRMTRLAQYLSEMATNLNVVDPDVRVDYEVPGAGLLKSLRQCDYRANVPDSRRPDEVIFQFVCRRDGSVNFEVEGKALAQRTRQRLWDHNLRFSSKLSADGDGSFSLERAITVSFEFTAQLDDGTIRLRVRNLDDLGSHNMHYQPEQLDDEFLEELGRAVLRKSNRFSELSGNTLSEDARRQLQQKLARDQYQKLSPEDQLLSENDEERGTRKGLFGR
ncbi:MAG: hypothetical protein AAF493_09260 [Pseudomonadota bacterium]